MWRILPISCKNDYRKRILGYTSLSKLFTQKADKDSDVTPILNSKYQEKQFCAAFGAIEEDVGNTSFDASLRLKTADGREHKFLIGIKTFGIDSGDQKIAQFKASSSAWTALLTQIQEDAKNKTESQINELHHDEYKEIALEIANLRNTRIKSSIENLKGFEVGEQDENIEAVYHVLMPSSKKTSEPFIAVGETSYDYIDVDHITIIGCPKGGKAENFVFTDGHHVYKYTNADSQLLMNFNNKDIIQETWPVKFLNAPENIMMRIYNQCFGEEDIPETIVVPHITQSASFSILNKDGEVERYSAWNAFYGIGSKIGKQQRLSTLKKFTSKYKNTIESSLLNQISDLLEYFLFAPSATKDLKIQKEEKRKLLLHLSQGMPEMQEDICNIVFRPMNELYIPIPNSKAFHETNPDFFAPGAGQFCNDHPSKLLLSKEERSFTLKFEPSGNTIDAFITQDNGKCIESCISQSVLGDWILRKIFQLEKYQPLTAKRLEEIGINGFRLYRTNTDDNVHLEFIYIPVGSEPADYWN